jgi:hypothetical protein
VILVCNRYYSNEPWTVDMLDVRGEENIISPHCQPAYIPSQRVKAGGARPDPSPRGGDVCSYLLVYWAPISSGMDCQDDSIPYPFYDPFCFSMDSSTLLAQSSFITPFIRVIRHFRLDKLNRRRNFEPLSGQSLGSNGNWAYFKSNDIFLNGKMLVCQG